MLVDFIILAIFLAGCVVIHVATSPRRSRWFLAKLGLAPLSDLNDSRTDADTCRANLSYARATIRDREAQIGAMFGEFEKLEEALSFGQRASPLSFRADAVAAPAERIIRLQTSAMSRMFDVSELELRSVHDLPNYLAYLRKRLAKEWQIIIERELAQFITKENLLAALDPTKVQVRRHGTR